MKLFGGFDTHASLNQHIPSIEHILGLQIDAM